MRKESLSIGGSSSGRRFLTGSILLLAAAGVQAQAPIGLSSVRAQAFFNETIGGNPPVSGEAFGQSLAAGDFNGDGAQDLATGIPRDGGQGPELLLGAGAVIVRWGIRGTGLSTAVAPGPTLLSLDAVGGPSEAHSGDYFGAALAAGDFNGDGLDDLAVGIPYFSDPSLPAPSSGGVAVHFGVPGGIQLAGEDLFRSGPNGNTFDIPGPNELFGRSLAAGDFDGDGYDDLAIGAPQYLDAGGGGVVVLHGTIDGLVGDHGYLIHQDDPLVPDVSEAGDEFGYALAAGNFDGDVRCNIEACAGQSTIWRSRRRAKTAWARSWSCWAVSSD